MDGCFRDWAYTAPTKVHHSTRTGMRSSTFLGYTYEVLKIQLQRIDDGESRTRIIVFEKLMI